MEQDAILGKACKIMRSYARVTGARVCVYDHNYLPAAESPAEDLLVSPCRELHLNASKESCCSGGSYIYRCDRGFVFWTSPLYSGGRFMGALFGSLPGFDFPSDTTEEKIQALAELMLICAESLSAGNGDYYETLKRRSEQQARLAAALQKLKEKYAHDAPPEDYPMDQERMLLASLRRGDHEEGKRILNEILAAILFSNPDQFKHIQFRAIELIVLLSRAGASPLAADRTMLETNNAYIRRMQEVKTIEDLTDALNLIVEGMAGRILSFQGIRHASVLRKAERFILENYSRKISLREIAGASGLSAPYFSTIFKEEMGENFSSYLNRLRVEKASRMLLDTNFSLSEIAGSCGFEDQSWFSKIFKLFTGISPGKYRSRNGGIIKEISEDNFSADCRSNIKKD